MIEKSDFQLFQLLVTGKGEIDLSKRKVLQIFPGTFHDLTGPVAIDVHFIWASQRKFAQLADVVRSQW